MLKNPLIFFISCYFLLSSCSTETEPVYSSLPADAVILAFGDSLTYGTGVGDGDSYPTILESLTGFTVINAGVPGEISRKGLNRLPELLDKHNPNLLILIHGGNDILRKLSNSGLKNNLIEMVGEAKKRKIPVILMGVPRFGILSLKSHKVYAEVVASENIPADLETLPQIIGNESLKSDQVHPNEEGYRLMAEAIFALLKESGAIP